MTDFKNGYDTLSQAIEDLQDKGYTIDYDLVEDGLKSKDLKKKWKAEELDVVKFYRFEGMADPGDNTILYVIECNDGNKGLLVDAYGADVYVSPKMIEKLRMNDQ
ncbi:phosphoribosylpyrophosphate synthetase [Nonlabens ponticola]|uniref:Phosphoribosylpyrophosphate synthetase n=1 Tax=Nonlabens ponticola TaxID=2496866 RepID=A0A3S9MWY2_9FLAO|nr:phosphoribosylpyrophosphate synthetase [Nonlabens ponticola]AZQ43731.1 phosphoribosylpyrophosphate synthetase [Nonlabens ponticola]